MTLSLPGIVRLPRSVKTLAAALLASVWLLLSPFGSAATVTGTTGISDWSLDRLMSTLAQNKSGHTRFVETKYLAIAAKPIESSGELAFAAPDHLEKITTSPTPERLVVDGDKLTVARDQRQYTVSLTHYPELDAFIESIRATLTGNRYMLERRYEVSVHGHGENWTMTLIPSDTHMLKAVGAITLNGTRDVLRTVVIEQPDGDRSVMRLGNAPQQ